MSGAGWQGTHSLSAQEVALALGLHPPTAEQRAVIEAPPGPALVVAGAGSGKTETMSGRVVWLVANGHVRRDEILGLTFTRKAAGELAERIGLRLSRIDEYVQRGLVGQIPHLVREGALEGVGSLSVRERHALLDALAERLGTDDASDASHELLLRPRVSTYNAFADGIVREHAARIGQDPDAAMLSSAGSWLLARSIVLASDDQALLERDDAVDTLVAAVLSLSGDVLDHRADLESVARFAEQLAEEIEPYTNPAIQNPTPPEKAWAVLRGLPLLTRLVHEYSEAKRSRGVREFGDQVAGALTIVERSPDVVRELREQYRVVLLDEYQDTSVIQTELLSTLFRDSTVMAVGDPNQAIYAWRGASADNLPAFATNFVAQGVCQRFDLSTSWRNDQGVLDAANALLAAAPAKPRFEVPTLRARPGAGEGTVERCYELTLEDEAAAVAEWCERQRDASGDPQKHSGALLFRSKKHMRTFAEALAARGIPHRILGLGGLLSTPEVADVVATLRVISDPRQGSALIRLLSGPRFAIGVADLAALRDLAANLSKRDAALQPFDAELLARIRGSAGTDEQLSIIDALEFLRTARDGYRLTAAFSEAGKVRLKEAADVFATLRRSIHQPLPELLRHIERELRLDIELAAHEQRGPARLASAQLRAFSDEARSFLESSDRSSISALLAWLEHASDADDLMPRAEPPEPGVIQLLTIHGSKGLEWDSVAVVRVVSEELPKRPRSKMGWMVFGRLPYPFRGDRDALPHLGWRAEVGETRKSLTASINAYSEAVGDYLEAEERRLAYVAVTRARSALLLSGSWWSGQVKPRAASKYLQEIVEACALPAIEALSEEDSVHEEPVQTYTWPLDPLGTRRERVQAASELVRGVVERATASPVQPAPSEELALLLAEREESQRGVEAVAPVRVPASRFKDYVADYGGTLATLIRPMPERPYRQTRLGTLFHAWVEQRLGMPAASAGLDDELWEQDAESGGPLTATEADEAELQRLRDIFEQSPWADRQAIAVELEIDFSFGAAGADAAESGHIIICKLDAVYAGPGGRIEIVDWKTGQAPRTPAQKKERMLQLALYRLAYHRRFGVPLDDIDVVLYYVGDNLIIRGEESYTESELFQRWSAARAAR